MEYRLLGGSGFRVPVLTLGTGTFGGRGDFFEDDADELAWALDDAGTAPR